MHQRRLSWSRNRVEILRLTRVVINKRVKARTHHSSCYLQARKEILQIHLAESLKISGTTHHCDTPTHNTTTNSPPGLNSVPALVPLLRWINARAPMPGWREEILLVPTTFKRYSTTVCATGYCVPTKQKPKAKPPIRYWIVFYNWFLYLNLQRQGKSKHKQ